MQELTIRELASHLQLGKISSVELVSDCIKTIKESNSTLNSFLSVSEERALHEAAEADRARQRGEEGPLLGIPLAHKDVICTEGIRTSCGSKMLDNFIAPYDASLVSMLKRAGAICVGKTNMDEFAMGSSNETSFYGSVANPWDNTRVPGGSSGGSAAAVAARLVPVATATDTGGSIRQPAAFCGVTGIKPTYGRVSRYGVVAFASSLDQAGVIAVNAEDAALVLEQMSGLDPLDSTSVEHSVDYTSAIERSIKGLKIGIPKQYFNAQLDTQISDCLSVALDELTAQGAQLVDIDLPNTKMSIPSYYLIASAECSSNLSRYDGVRYGHRCADPVNLDDLYTRSRSEGFGAEVKRRILLGTFALSSGYYDDYYLKAQKARRQVANDFQNAFKCVDMIAAPVTPEVAFPLGAKKNDPLAMYLSDVFTVPASLAGLPAMSIPAGFSQSLPVGLQLIAPHFQEAALFNVAHRYQLSTGWHLQKPTGARR